MLKAPKRKDGYMKAYETNERIICGATVEEKEVYDRAVDYMNDSKYYLEKKKDMRTAFGCIEYSHGLLDALRMIHGLI